MQCGCGERIYNINTITYTHHRGLCHHQRHHTHHPPAIPPAVLRAVFRRMQSTLHATRRTPPHGASRLVQAMSAWWVKTQRAPSRHSRDARVYGHTTTAMHKLSTPPSPPTPPPSSHLTHHDRHHRILIITLITVTYHTSTTALSP